MALIRILSSAVATLASQDFKRLDCKESHFFSLQKTSKFKNMSLLKFYPSFQNNKQGFGAFH